MTSERRNVNAVSGKTARACDCCIKKRARWYCPADDAFLCQVCDGSVHSANPLARRHERVRLKTASSLKRADNSNQLSLPSWHRGLTRKPRTPRHGKSGHQGSKSEESTGVNNPVPIVPQLGMDEMTSSQDEEPEDQLLYRVPIFEPFVAEICSSTTTSSCTPPVEVDHGLCTVKSQVIKSPQDEYMPSDMDLEEFAADVETLLGTGLDDESYGIEQLGLLNCIDATIENDHNTPLNLIAKFPVKEENDHDHELREPFELSFHYDDHHEFPSTCEVQEDHKVGVLESPVGCGAGNQELYGKARELKEDVKKRKVLLKLDYEAISNAWATRGSPWINGQRPDITPHDCWPHCMGTCGIEMHHPLYIEHQLGAIGGHGVVGDGGREARVSRYREKRRTRLFAKKIRYEVRKLNAEKRPRMKGRFVKRSSFAPTMASFPVRSK